MFSSYTILLVLHGDVYIKETVQFIKRLIFFGKKMTNSCGQRGTYTINYIYIIFITYPLNIALHKFRIRFI